MDFSADFGINTLLAHYGEEEKIKGAVIPPLFQNSLFTFDTYEEFCEGIYNRPQGPPYHYSRLGNPTLELAERKIAALEGAEACKLCGTGMGAITMAIMTAVAKGSHVVSVDTCYPPVRQLLQEYLANFGVTVTFVSGQCADEMIAALRPETTLVYLESPSSFIFRLQDIEAITAETRKRGITTVIDNTYCTPLFCNPLKLGVDIVVHSATKYLSGHSDLTGGAICTTQERVDRMVRSELNLFGSIMAPFPAWLLTRGMRTLGVRMRQHQENGNTIAKFLEEHSQVEIVNHPGLESYPQRELYQKQMRGTGGLLSFQPKFQQKEQVVQFVEALNLFALGISWGGFESLVVPLHIQPMDYPEPMWTIRLFCGLEDSEDLVRDLTEAFDKVSAA